jgi:hypothetical protein
MFKLSSVLLAVLTLSSCQSFNSVSEHSPNQRRYIANIGSGVLKGFIDDISAQTRNSTQRFTNKQIEKKALEYIKKNHKKLGITKAQADEIGSIYDDLPYMNKVHKHLTRNITDVIPVNSSIAEKAYSAIVKKSASSLNPYSAAGRELREGTLAARSSASPNSPLNFDDAVVRQEIRSVDNVTVRKTYQDNYKLFKARQSTDPIAAANINEIIESATVVYNRTGKSAMGKGCKKFNENASSEVLEVKANIDIEFAIAVEKKAFEKAGGPFKHHKDIPDNKKLTVDEIEEVRVATFQKQLNYTAEEAATAVKRLKRAPCQVY